MSAIATPDEVTVFDIFRYCQQAFRKAGVPLAFPAGTNPRKTYKWRNLESFISKIDEWQLDLRTAYRLIDAMIAHAKEHKQLRSRGLSILTSASILEIGYDSITRQDAGQDGLVQIVSNDLKFLEQYPDRLEALLDRGNRGGPNILKWHMQGKISSTLLATSKSCCLAMQQLTPIERSMLPERIRLVEIQQQCLATVALKYRLKVMLGADWGVLC